MIGEVAAIVEVPLAVNQTSRKILLESDGDADGEFLLTDSHRRTRTRRASRFGWAASCSTLPLSDDRRFTPPSVRSSITLSWVTGESQVGHTSNVRWGNLGEITPFTDQSTRAASARRYHVIQSPSRVVRTCGTHCGVLAHSHSIRVYSQNDVQLRPGTAIISRCAVLLRSSLNR